MTLDLDSLHVFVKVAELASFTRAAEQLEVPKARVSFRVKQLEDELGAKLLQRSTRIVRLTAEGDQLLARARRLLAEADEVAGLFQAGRGIRGRVRLDLPVGVAREVVIPRLPDLLARHPELELTVGATDRIVAPQREGFDCVLRVGSPSDLALIGRRLGTLSTVNCASPGYLRAYGVPQRLEDLERHVLVHYSSTLGADSPTFEYPAGNGYRELPMRSVVTVNNVDAYHAACIAGLGLIQVPRMGVLASFAAGKLVEVLPRLTCAPLPVSLFHTHGRSVPRRVRAVMNWLTEQLTPYFDAHAEPSA